MSPNLERKVQDVKIDLCSYVRAIDQILAKYQIPEGVDPLEFVVTQKILISQQLKELDAEIKSRMEEIEQEVRKLI